MNITNYDDQISSNPVTLGKIDLPALSTKRNSIINVYNLNKLLNLRGIHFDFCDMKVDIN